MDISQILGQIKENVRKNKNEWDLTDDEGNPLIHCYGKDIPIADLAINKDETVCALIPLSYFPDEVILDILEIM